MKIRPLFFLLFAYPVMAQIPSPQIPLAGNIGAQGFPVLNSGTLIMATDANRTMTAQETSATGGIKVTSSVPLTATRNLILPSGNFQFIAIENATTGGQSIQVIASTGTGVTIANGSSATVWFDGTNVVQTGSSGGSLPSGTGLVGVVGGAGQIATPAQTVTSLGISSGGEAYGDSTACATGATSTTSGLLFRSAAQNGYLGLLQSVLGGDLNNYCYSGASQTDMNNFAFSHADNEGVGSPTYFGEQGINDATNTNATNAGYQNSFKYGVQGQVLFRTIPRTNKVFAQDAAVTTTGTWVADTNSQYGWGIASTTNGSTFSCPVTIGSDGNGIVWALQKDGNAGTWTGSWSGTGGGSLIDPVTSSTTFTAAGYGGIAIAGVLYSSQYVGYIYSGLSAGTHTFTGTVTSSTGAGNIVDFGGCGSLPAANTNAPWDFEAGVPYQNSGSGGAADATTLAFNNLVSGVVTTLSALPLNVKFVDIRNTLLNAPACGNGVEATMFANCYADQKHLNNLGYATEVNTASTGYTAIVTSANTGLTVGALKDPRTGPTSVYPNLPAPVDTSHWWSPSANANTSNGYGVRFFCAGGGDNCSGIGNLTNYGTSVVMGGVAYNLLNCSTYGYNTPIKATGCTQFITAATNGAMGFFGTGGSANNGYDYFSNSSTFLGGFPGYNQTGVFLTAVNSGVATQSAATSGTNYNSPKFLFRGAAYTGGINFPADVFLYNVVGTGSNPAMSLTLSSQNSTGLFNLDLSYATGVNKIGSALATSIIDSGITSGTSPICPNGTGGAFTTTGCSGGGLSGMTAGQIPVAATATTVTSSKPLVGAGTGGIPTVPATQIASGNVVVADASGGMADSGRPPTSPGTAGQGTFTNLAANGFTAGSFSGDFTCSASTIGLCTLAASNTSLTTITNLALPATQITSGTLPHARLSGGTNCNTSDSYYYSPFSGNCVLAGGSGTINAATQYSPAYYSAAGSATTISGVTPFTGIPYFSTSAAPAVVTQTQINTAEGGGTAPTCGTVLLGQTSGGVANWLGLTGDVTITNCTYATTTIIKINNIAIAGETVSYSATPTFSVLYVGSTITLAGGISSWTLANGTYDMQEKILTFCQDATGSHTVAGTPTTVHGFFTIGATASKCSSQPFRWNAVQSAWLATSTGVINE